MEESGMVELSICIPVYNGGKQLLSCVENILSYKGKNIEVVVSDNASDDGSIEELKGWKDDRLSIYVNEENLGPVPNWYRALIRGKGRYVMLLRDNDDLVVENLDKYLDWLSHISYDIIRNAYANREHFSGEVTAAQMLYYGKVFSHTSLIAYKKEAIQGIEPLSDSVRNGCISYPWCVWDMQIIKKYSLNAKRSYINGNIEIVRCKNGIMPSRTRKYAILTPFAYDTTVIEFGRYADMLRTIYLNDKDYAKLYCGLYRGELYGATFVFYEAMHNADTKKRYEIDIEDKEIDYIKLNHTFLKHAMQVLKLNSKIKRFIVDMKLHTITAKNRTLFKLVYVYERNFKNPKFLFGCIENKILGWIVNIVI